MPSSSLTIISRSTVYPDHKSPSHELAEETLRLSVSDLPMLACHYIQKGVLLTTPPQDDVVSHLKASLSTTLTHFPPLAGRLTTHPDSGHIHITLNDFGVEFIHASAKHLTLSHLLRSSKSDIPDAFKLFFTFDSTLSYTGHTKPLAAVQVTELADGLFIGCTVNHSVVDGTSFWHFFNTFAHISKHCSASNSKPIPNMPDFTRNTPFDSSAVLRIPPGGPKATFADDEPLRERIFHFSKQAISDLKSRANNKVIQDSQATNLKIKLCTQQQKAHQEEISSFQSLSAQLWRSVTRARNLSSDKKTTFRMAVNCRLRLQPSLSPHYFGNAIQSIPSYAPAGDLLSNDLNWAADQLH